jgi:hypothetical protein
MKIHRIQTAQNIIFTGSSMARSATASYERMAGASSEKGMVEILSFTSAYEAARTLGVPQPLS